MESLLSGGLQVGSDHGSGLVQFFSDYWKVSTALLAMVVSVFAFISNKKWRVFVVAGVFLIAAVVVAVMYIELSNNGVGPSDEQAKAILANAENDARVKLRQAGLNDSDIRHAVTTQQLKQESVRFEGHDAEVTRSGVVMLRFEAEGPEVEEGMMMGVFADGARYGTGRISWRNGTTGQIEFAYMERETGFPEPDSVKSWILQPEFDCSKANPDCYVPVLQLLIRLQASKSTVGHEE